MSIPERLWRVLRGHWELATDRLDDLERAAAEAAAYEELAEAVRRAPQVEPVTLPEGPRVLPPPAPPSRSGHRDPLEACYALLKVEPGADLAVLERAYEARLAEIRPEQYAAGSAERA